MTEAERIRAEYEQSVSWRVTGPLRTAKRRIRSAAGRALPEPASPAPTRYDTWLTAYHGDLLETIDAACADGSREHFARFRGLDVDLWAMLLTQEYECYPHIKGLLPTVPGEDWQELWTGASGTRLANQTKGFYKKVSERNAQHGGTPLADARVLDFGCGWGRVLRFFARDVAPGRLHGCDPVEDILNICRFTGVPAELTRTPFLPERLPYAEPFDLAYAFSVFTHLSARAADTCLRALHGALRPGGLLVITVRPPDYLRYEPQMRGVLAGHGGDVAAIAAAPHLLFVPHGAEPSHPQHQDGEMTYGETVITLPYLRERWGDLFEVLEANVLLDDLYQVAVTLRRR